MDWLATLLTLTGLWRNGQKQLDGWYYWLASNVVWILHWLTVYAQGDAMQWSSVLLNVVLFALNLRGLYTWKGGQTPTETCIDSERIRG